MATVTMDGKTITISGALPRAGTAAPDFRLVGSDLADVTLRTFAGKRKILNIVPSLDTRVCSLSARRFDTLAAGLANTVVLVVSADLPFAMKRACSDAGLEHVIPLSLMRGRAFAQDSGVLMTDGPMEGITARAVVVLDESNRVIHAQLVGDIGDEPDYDAAIAAARG